ncbi:DNA segregation ATPase FtsK/SpoIIIE, S-DNA-T family [Paenibacillus sp. cl6col]|uniref:type VII secretion protein EssC n=1 Tax=Paenibacillus sp. cl6col TaxID=1761878 RepID=UPI00088A53C8|nr:type VII secretion protein EssC [Paenibacillus sp. cl6col]SDE64263.1 DNA segregation ATPase FtsK/SpoIIIE, S-DNA-T family [Paenibacillus sp. cl6col]
MNVMYQRSPRIKPELPEEKLEILRPPAEPSRPTFSIVTLIIPIVMTLVSIGFYIYMSMSGKMGNSNYMMFQMITISMMLMSYTLPFFLYLSNKRQYVRKQAERSQMYLAQLEKHRLEIIEKQHEQRAAMYAIHGDPDVCHQIVKNRNSSLWERGPFDVDFMDVRIGTGEVPFYMPIITPRTDGYEKDPLIEAAHKLEQDSRTVDEVPITLPLYESKVVGIVGDKHSVMEAVRIVIAQLTTRHSPDEVKLAALYDEQEAENWGWLRWLPHTWNDDRTQRYLADRRSTAHQLADQLYGILNRRKSFQTTGEKKKQLPIYVVLLQDSQMIEEEPLYPLLLEEASRVDSCTLVLSDRKERLPMQCRLIVEVGADTAVSTQKTDQEGIVQHSFHMDHLSADKIDTLARYMAPIRLKRSAASDLPPVLTLFDMFGVEQVDQLKLVERWNRNRYPDTLPVPVGVRAGGKLVSLNLHDKIERKGHGPHGLLAGTTGSGKSEVIQSLIASLAAEYHPHDVAFMLIDYKGGGMSNTFEKLPHVVGTITNLDESLIERAQVSLRAELIRRQHILNDAGNMQHIDEYYKSPLRYQNPLPHLIIIIDEFAQLKKDQPEFMDELISIAAIGRTLGVHLLLATQKPAGVVDEKIWSNTRFRICLRVQSEGDSRDMLKIPNAAWITHPGRGYFQVGSDEVFEEMQFAWSGAPYLVKRQEGQPLRIEVSEVRLNGKMEALLPSDTLLSAYDEQDQLKQLQVFIDAVAEAACCEGINRLQGPWLAPLPQELGRSELFKRTRTLSGVSGDFKGIQPIVGLLDDVMNQRQEPLGIEMDHEHWAVYGMPGTGKTTFVQTLLMSLAEQYEPDVWHGYVVDMGRMLKDYADLPHVGAVIAGEDEDRLKRLFRYLLAKVKERTEMLSEAGVKTIASYRQVTQLSVPNIVVIIDGYLNFRTSYPDENECLEYLLREGGSLAISFVITANRVTDIFDKFRSNISNAISYELADPSDYYFAVGRPARTPARLQAGRGLIKHNGVPIEFQTAYPADGNNDVERVLQLRSQIRLMHNSWQGAAAPLIRSLPERVRLSELLKLHDDSYEESEIIEAEQLQCSERLQPVPVGVRTDDLEPYLVNLKEGPHFVVASPMESGKTSFLTSWMLSLAYHMSPERLHIYAIDVRYGDNGVASLRDLPHVREIVTEEERIPGFIQQVYDQVSSRSKDGGDPILLLVMDDADMLCKQLTDYTVKDQLSAIVRQGRDKGVHLVLAGVPSDFPTFGVDWFNDVKASQAGFLFGTIDANDLSFFRIPISESQSSGPSGSKVLPPGQGYFVRRKFTKIKTAIPYDEKWTPAAWTTHIHKRWKVRV